MTAWAPTVAVLMTGAAVFIALGPKTELSRLHRLRGQLSFHRNGDLTGRVSGSSAVPQREASRHRQLGGAAITGLGVTMIVDGAIGLLVGAGAGIGSYVVLRRLTSNAQVPSSSPEQAALAAQLLASVLAAGCSPVVAAEVVGTALSGPLGETLVKCGAAARLGSSPTQAWQPLMRTPHWRSIGRAFSIAATRGTSPVPVLQRAAEDARDEARWAGEARALSLGAKSAAPLGLCFLPAFVLLAIVPVVVTSF